jgi:hypothetical protein
LATFELRNALRDELATQHWDRSREIEWLPHLGMYLLSDHLSYAFVQIPEPRREAALVEKANAGNKGVVKRRYEPFEFLLRWIRNVVQPLSHERPEEITNSFR